MIVQLCLAICDMEPIACNQFGSKLQIGPKVSAAMAGVCAVVGCGPGMGGSAAIRFAKAGYKIAGMCRTADSFVPTQDGCGKDQVPSVYFFLKSISSI